MIARSHKRNAGDAAALALQALAATLTDDARAPSGSSR